MMRERGPHPAGGVSNRVPVALIAGAVLVLLIVAVAAPLAGLDYGYLTRDPAQIGGISPYAGFLSGLGVLAWAGAAFVAAFGAALLYARAAPGGQAGFLAAYAALSLALCLDDFYLLHESLPGDEKILFAAYGLVFLGLLVTCRREILRSRYRYLVFAIVCLAGSVGIDVVQSRVEAVIGDARILFEDGAKFLGAVAWLAYAWVAALDLLTPGSQSAPAASMRE